LINIERTWKRYFNRSQHIFTLFQMAAKVKKIDLHIMNTQKKCEKSDVASVDQLEEVLNMITLFVFAKN